MAGGWAFSVGHIMVGIVSFLWSKGSLASCLFVLNYISLEKDLPLRPAYVELPMFWSQYRLIVAAVGYEVTIETKLRERRT